jgi:integrase
LGLKDGSKRQKALVTLTKEEFQKLRSLLREPVKTMATVAMCAGLRISEILPLRWESLDFEGGSMMVERTVVNGRIGPTRTETSRDEVPLDGDLAEILLEWKAVQNRSSGLYKRQRKAPPLSWGSVGFGLLKNTAKSFILWLLR